MLVGAGHGRQVLRRRSSARTPRPRCIRSWVACVEVVVVVVDDLVVPRRDEPVERVAHEGEGEVVGERRQRVAHPHRVVDVEAHAVRLAVVPDRAGRDLGHAVPDEPVAVADREVVRQRAEPAGLPRPPRPAARPRPGRPASAGAGCPRGCGTARVGADGGLGHRRETLSRTRSAPAATPGSATGSSAVSAISSRALSTLSQTFQSSDAAHLAGPQVVDDAGADLAVLPVLDHVEVGCVVSPTAS